MREEIDLSRYRYDKKKANCSRLPQKTGKKDMVVVEKYPDAEIWPPLAKQILIICVPIYQSAKKKLSAWNVHRPGDRKCYQKAKER
ncbi:MAG: hypothetical protein LUF78_10395 [Clostridiales bacterium]|nr:hypothetical protein [Clostridiales bacterium]